jgi:Carboxypeptidase regulatory-like domain
MKNVMLFSVLIWGAAAQVPTGSIAGVVRDPTGAPVLGGRIRIVNAATNLRRSSSTSAQGDYSFPLLPAGEYELAVEADGFPRTTRIASVEAGATTTADFALRLGDVKESISVDDASPQVQYDSHSVGGVITQSQIQDLPLNGRSFLELAKLEPGVQPPTRAQGNRTYVPALGAPGGPSGRGTRVTVDGGSVMAFSTGGSVLGLSQDLVQEFQISTANFDLSTGMTFTGAINVATRSGANELHGSAYYFFRDHNLSAYPNLKRDPANPDPFFQRRQFGFAAGGPIRRDRLFFFGNWERNEQRGVVTTTVLSPDFAHLSRITPSPLFGDELSFRMDGRFSTKHNAFLRYSHDGSRAFVNNGANTANANAYPSNWVRQFTWADQSVLGLTSVLRPMVVNDFRFSYFFISDNQLPPEQQNCPECIGIGGPAISVGSPAIITIGQSGTTLNPGRRLDLNDSMAWQRGAHRMRFGVEWEHNRGGALAWTNDPVTMTLFTPAQVRTFNSAPQTPADRRISLPAAFDTLDQILQLPLQSVTVGTGDPRVPQANGSLVRTWNTVRLYFQDSWRVSSHLTLDYGLAWNVDRFKNYDLPKPQLLAPILGAGGLGPTRKEWKNFSPSVGFAWAPAQDKKTVIRAGAGIYYDFFFGANIDNERALLGPPGLGRQSITGSNIFNPLPGIAGLPVGASLNITGSPTQFTGVNLLSILPAIRAGLAGSLVNSDPSLQAIQIFKQTVGGTTNGLFPEYVPNPSAQHFNAGVQREIARDFVLTADLVFRHFIHGGLGPGGLDLNHFNSVRGPVIPACTPAQRTDPRALCSNGSITVWEATSNQTYKGLLLRADKRFSHGFQILGSYAWSSDIGTPGPDVQNPANGATNPGLNLDDWHQHNAPLITDYTHIANVAGVMALPWRFDLGLNFSYSNAPPFSPIVGNIDFNGDGTTGDLLPGTTTGQFNRGLGHADLVRLVDQFNQNYALKPDPHGIIIPRITLPASYSFDHGYQSLDLRLSRTFALRERWRLRLIGEVFNLYNAANLSGYSNDLTNAAFGQPTARFTQLFGSGGPRSFQLAARISF